jgi:hypothetical protein
MAATAASSSVTWRARGHPVATPLHPVATLSLFSASQNPDVTRILPSGCFSMTIVVLSDVAKRLRTSEIYPSARDPLPDEIKDRGQVRAMWQWPHDLDQDNLLWREFCRPIEVETGSKEDLAIQLTEGWILGCSPTVTNQ